MTSKHLIKQCSIVLTRACNLRCNFCYVKNEGFKADSIKYEDIIKIIDFCCEAKVKYIFFTGGEPLLYKRLAEVFHYIKTRSHTMQIAIATNGVLLSDIERCKSLINSGVDYIDISMKGRNKEDWYILTGYDKLEAHTQAIKNLATLKVNFTCSMVITSDNVHYFYESVQNAYNCGARQFSFTFIIDNDNDETSGFIYLQKHNPIKLVDDFIFQIDKLNAITDDWWVEYSFPLCLYTQEHLQVLKGRLATPCQVHLKNAVTFDINMELLPCDMYIHHKLGKLGRDFSSYTEFIDFINSDYYNNMMQKIWESPSDECKLCNSFELCYGGCPVLWKHYSYDDLKHYKKLYSVISNKH